MPRKVPLNGRQKGIRIHCNGINKTFPKHETHARKGKNGHKSGVLGAKSGFLELKKYELATKLERQNGAKCMF